MSYRYVDANDIIGKTCNIELQNYINEMPCIYADIKPNNQHIFTIENRESQELWKSRLSEVFDNVSCLEGVVTDHGEDEISIQAGHFDDYLLMALFSKMITEGEVEIRISDRRMNYFLKLLHLDKGEDGE